MEILRNAGEFRDYLHSLAASTNQSPHLSDRLQVYKEEYAITVLPAGTATPFDDFTGQLEGATLVVSKYEPTLSQDSELGLSALEGSLSSEENEQVQELEGCSEPPSVRKNNKFPCVFYQAVKVGQPLSQKRQFLTQSTPLHSGHAEHDLVADCTLAYDAGVTPLTLNKARYIASLYALRSRETTHGLPNLWVICDDERRNITALGCSHSITEGKRSLQSCTVTAESVLSKSQAPGAEKHKASSKGNILNRSENSAFSEYEIASYSITEGNDSGDKLMGDLTVQFAWSSPDSVLSSPPESADAVIKVSATPGYIFSPGLACYNELNTLLRLCRIVTGEESWPTPADRVDQESPTAQSTTPQLSEKVGSFLADVSSPLSPLKEMTVVSPTSENKLFEQRKDLDFVERLWLFAKDATSLEDLQRTFAEVFKAVLLGKVQPFVHRNSTSVLSSLLRKVLLTPSMEEKQDLAPKFQNLLTETKICACLVQIGVEKMTRDYRAFFIGADIATGDQLHQFISLSQGSQLDQCHALCKLHCILELMSSILLLRLPPPTLSALFKTALEVYRERKFEGFCTTPVFSLPLPAYSSGQKTLASFCSRLTPKRWVLSQPASSKSGVSDGGGRLVIVVYANQPLLDNIKDGETDKDSYHVYKAQCECI